MRTRIQCVGLEETQPITDHIERQIYLSLGRYLPEIQSVSVKLRRVEASQPLQHECMVTLRTAWKDTIQLHEKAPEATVAASRAADLTGRLLSRQISLRRAPLRGRQLAKSGFGD